jgi:ssDNA-binding Zn-finger/Zn-ribbon topoisomerase 1
MKEIESKPLSKIKSSYCVHCYSPISFNLSQRRGESKIKCKDCGKQFSISNIEVLNNKLSKITNGNCPNCESNLELSISDRLSSGLILCPNCNDEFYLKELENPTHKTENSMPSVVFNQSDLTRHQITVVNTTNGKEYYMSQKGFNKKLFFNWTVYSTIISALIISFVNKPVGLRAIGYTFSDWFIDFIGLIFAFFIPCLLVGLFLGYSLSQKIQVTKDEVTDILKS